MHRRSFIRGTVASAAAGSYGVANAQARRRRSGPNFLFILADDLGYADLSCYGREDYSTPNIDALAKQGMQFMQAYSNSSVCTATRVALITGRYQYRLPIGLEEPLVSRAVGLPIDQPTLPSMLKSVGYATCLIGKWHLGSLPDYGPLQSGYEKFWGFRGGGVDYFTHAGFGNQHDLWDGDSEVHETGYLTDLLADRAIRTLEDYAEQERPFLMSLHFNAPHWPWEGPGDKAESERLAASKNPVAIVNTDGGSREIYASMVTRLDMQVGRIMDALLRLGLSQETVVVFTSDNGGERFTKTWPFSGRKTELLEGGIRIPAIVRWPGTVKPDSRSEAPIMSMDWLPTFLRVAGVAPDPSLPSDGADLFSVLTGGQGEERALFWRYKNHAQEAMRLGHWKYLKIKGHSYLFNLDADPLEQANLSAREPERFASMQRAWIEWNNGMLSIDPNSDSHGINASMMAERYAVDSPAAIALPGH
jgi:arylsulfatase A-like enzyme